MTERVVAIVQARLRSERLPGKVLKELAPERSMLALILERIGRCQALSTIVVAIPEQDESSALSAEVKGCGAHLFLGSELDVLDRYYKAAQAFDASHVVRVTSDCPLVAIDETDELVAHHLAEQADFTHNITVWGSGLPLGAGAEVFRLSALQAAWHDGVAAYHREHVDEFVYEHPERFRIRAQRAAPELNRPHYRLTVDTREDLQLLRQLYATLYHPGIPVPLATAVSYLDTHQELLDLNRHIVQKVR